MQPSFLYQCLVSCNLHTLHILCFKLIQCLEDRGFSRAFVHVAIMTIKNASTIFCICQKQKTAHSQVLTFLFYQNNMPSPKNGLHLNSVQLSALSISFMLLILH